MWSFQPGCEFVPNEAICHPTPCPQHCSKPTYFAWMSEQAIVGSLASVKMGDPLPINFPWHEAKCFNLAGRRGLKLKMHFTWFLELIATILWLFNNNCNCYNCNYSKQSSALLSSHLISRVVLLMVLNQLFAVALFTVAIQPELYGFY